MRWVVVVFLYAFAFGAEAQKVPLALSGDEQVAIDADSISYDQRNNTVTASGHVIIRRGQTELFADQVILHRLTNEAEAYGNVSVSDPEGILFAESVLLNLDEETGALSGASIKSRRLQYSLWGSRIEKGYGQSYRIQNGHFTTCNCESGRQSWSISGKHLDVTLDGYGVLEGATFNVLDVPILYLPKAVIPVERDRQSGFLMPRFGASNRRGFQTLAPFYWAISKSQDATLAFDVETSARIGGLAEYRYALTRDSRGTLDASYFNESIRGDQSSGNIIVPEDRWSVRTDQRQQTFGDGRAYSDVLLVSDDQFFREINTYAFDHNRTVAIRTLPYTVSRLGAVQLWDRAAAKIEGSYFQNLGDDVESRTVQVAPRLDVWAQQSLGSFMLADVAAHGANFQRSQGPAGGRVDIHPGITFPIPVERFGFGSVRVGAQETAYALSERTLEPTTIKLPESSNRELVDVRAEMGSVLQRVYDVQSFGIQRIKHTIEPTAGYFYVPATDQSDLPLWDGVDRINHRNLVTYGVTSRFIGKESEDSGAAATATTRRSPIRELARFSVMQSYDISREIPAVARSGAADHFSDIDLAGRINPNRFFSFRFLTNYDTSSGDFSAARVGFFIEDPRDRDDEQTRRLDTRTSAGVSYRFLTNDLLQQVDTNLVLKLTDWAGLFYSSRYNVVADRFLDNFFGLRLISSCDCWALDIAVTNRSNPSETEARAQLTLVGLSSPKRATRVAVMP